jgi:hypothetical protein
MRSFKILFLCVSVVWVAACSKSGGRSISSTDDSSTPTSYLESGTYSTPCAASGPASSSFEVVVTANTMDFTNILYDDGACAQPRIKFSHQETYVDVAASGAQTGARNINSTMGKLFYTPLTVAAATDSNGWVECGFSDWAVNVSKDVSATSCQGIPLNTLTYTIARTANDQFEVGMPDPNDVTQGSTENLRITTFIPFVFDKQ